MEREVSFGLLDATMRESSASISATARASSSSGTYSTAATFAAENDAERERCCGPTATPMRDTLRTVSAMDTASTPPLGAQRAPSPLPLDPSCTVVDGSTTRDGEKDVSTFRMATTMRATGQTTSATALEPSFGPLQTPFTPDSSQTTRSRAMEPSL